MSGSAKLIAIGCTYPYQVIRSRIQVRSLRSPSPRVLHADLDATHRPLRPQYQPPTTPDPYKSIPDCVRRTYLSDGLKGFYKGLGTNAVRILPGTCVTFVVYENVARWVRERAVAKGERRD